jgi:Conserved Oligomeric Golgi complex subunit 6, C-terminal
MSVYESSVLGNEDPEEQRRGFKQILDAAIDPALEMCRRMADMNSKDATGWERSVFLINCLDYLQVIRPLPRTVSIRRSHSRAPEYYAAFCFHKRENRRTRSFTTRSCETFD